MLAKLKLLCNHERYQVVAVVVVTLFIIYCQSCQSTCNSLIESDRKVTRGELQAEVDLILARAKDRVRSLDDQDAVKLAIAENAALFSQTGTVNPLGLLTTVLGIFGFGAVVDNMRRRKEEKTNNSSSSSK